MSDTYRVFGDCTPIEMVLIQRELDAAGGECPECGHDLNDCHCGGGYQMFVYDHKEIRDGTR